MQGSRQFSFAVLLSALIVTTEIASQPLHFENISISNGLPSTELYCVLQDSKGYLWFSSDAGVCRYDGYAFRCFSSRDNLADNTIFNIREDKKGRIWFTALNGRLCYYYQDSIYQIEGNQTIQKYIEGDIIQSIAIDDKDIIWLGLTRSPYCIKVTPPYDTKSVFKKYWQESGTYLYRPDQNTAVTGNKQSAPTPKIKLIYQQEGKKTFQYEGEKTNWFSYLPEYQLLDNNRVLIGINNELLLITDTTIRFLFKTPGHILSLLMDRKGNLWVGLRGNGLIRYRHPFQNTITEPEYLIKNVSVSSICEDHEGGLWFTTLGNGVYYLRSQHYFTGITDFVHNILQPNCVFSNEDITLIGQPAGSAYEMSETGIHHINLELDSTIRNTVLSFFPLKGKKILIRTLLACFEYDYEKKKTRTLKTPEMKSFYARCGTYDGKNTIWLATFNHLYRVDAISLTVKEILPAPARINSLLCESSDSLWIGTIQGLYLKTPAGTSYYGNKDPSLSLRIDDMVLQENHKIVLATRGNGLVQVKNGNVTGLLTVRNGLPTDFCRSLTLDKKGCLWVTGNRGICKIESWKNQTANLKTFGTKNGMATDEIFGMTLRNDEVWAASNKGIIRFHPDSVNPAKTQTPCYITSFRVNGSENTIRSFPEQVLPYDNYSIDIGYTGITFVQPDRMLFRFKLDENDTGWTVTSQRSIQLPKIKPGSYHFRVNAMNPDGTWSSQTSSLPFRIESPYWEKSWFYTLCVSGFLLLTWTLFSYRYKRMKHREREKAVLSRQIAELEVRALRSQMNPHFIFNSLNSIRNFILKEKTEQADLYFSVFSRLIRNVLENSRQEKITLQKEIATLNLYLEMESLRFRHKFNYMVLVAPGLDTMNTMLPPMLVQPLAENAIWHGLIPKESSGTLRIEFRKEAGMLVCIVDDDGIGREKSKMLKKESSNPHSSVGLNITRDRLKLIRQSEESEARLLITDKSNPSGTRAEIYLPLTYD